VAAGDVRYELIVTYALTPADDIDVFDEGMHWRESYGSSVDALSDLGTFIQNNGGASAWNQGDNYCVGSCWLPEGEGIEVSYQTRLDRIHRTDGQRWTPLAEERRPALLTWRRLDAANGGSLRRDDDPGFDTEVSACPTR
jgi:hypothetical protein